MNPVERLRRDHQVLRAKLSVLESALGMGEDAWFVLRELCHSLAGQLKDHLQREEALLAAYRPQLGERRCACLTVEHHDEAGYLRTINRLFFHDPARAFPSVRGQLANMIHALRAHMDDEEAQVFPQLEHCSAPHAATVSSAPRSAPVRETMTVNRVLLEHPRTLPVFKRLFVSIPYEGCDCLDEVAWRHGMETRELIALLEHAASEATESSPDEPAPEPTHASND